MTAAHTTVALPAVLVQDNAQAIATELAGVLGACAPNGGEAVLDATALAQFDSSALAVILACRRAVEVRGAQLRITGLPERAQALAKVYGLSALVQ
jgi:phospholipid transport system transporter-binding protein